VIFTIALPLVAASIARVMAMRKVGASK
ncbi:MAG TPA: spermidine/putrescine ABC transporter permease, partial [Thalassospira sp.]|nr:spermidine/putrescine ABC transporter permease [Thalassospira sp.]